MEGGSIAAVGRPKSFPHLCYYLSPYFCLLKSIRKASYVSLTRLELVLVSATREVELPTIRSNMSQFLFYSHSKQTKGG